MHRRSRLAAPFPVEDPAVSFAQRFIGVETLLPRMSELDVEQFFSLSKDDISAVCERRVSIDARGLCICRRSMHWTRRSNLARPERGNRTITPTSAHARPDTRQQPTSSRHDAGLFLSPGGIHTRSISCTEIKSTPTAPAWTAAAPAESVPGNTGARSAFRR